MSLEDYFKFEAHQREKKDLPLLNMLIERYHDEGVFEGCRVASSHLLVANSMVVIEALAAGGAQVLLADAFDSPATQPVKEQLAALSVDLLSPVEAARGADLYLDVNAILGRQHRPRAAAEVTRTGVHHYAAIDCPVISADDCRAKRIEGFFGTGDGFQRAWRQLRPDDSLAGKRVLSFGYGKIGRGVAHCLWAEGMEVTVADKAEAARQQAEADGFAVLDGEATPDMQAALDAADIVIAVTGVPGSLGRSLPTEWLKESGAVLVNLGAEDEFGPQFEEAEILGGKQVPLNFHLAQPTRNRYVDPPLAAHILALEAWVRAPEKYVSGIHPLPEEMDRWLVTEWRKAWPDEDLTGIADELGTSD